MSFEYFIGGRYLWTKQRQAFISLITFLSIAGVTVGVMALIVVIAVMTGATSDFKSRILGVESHIVLLKHGGFFSEYSEIMKKVKRMDKVTSASPFVYTQAMLRSPDGVAGVVLRGIDPASSAKEINSIGKSDMKHLLAGKDEKETPGFVPGIILGKVLASNLHVDTGDMIYLISFRGMLSPVGHMPSMKRFKVKGLFESGMYEYDGSLAYIHIKDAQKVLRMGDSVNGIGIRVNDIYLADSIANQITDDLGRFPYYARDWMQMNQALFSALKLEKTAMFVILTLIVLVAAFNIASTLIMMVMAKTRDIAILKAMGATDRSVMKIFVFNGMVIGSIGTGLGICFGSAVCELLKRYKFIELPPVYPFSTLPVQLEFMDVFMIALAAIMICFLATLYPAYQASKMDPVEAIRYG